MNNISHNAAVEVTIIPPIQERVKKTNETLQADFSKIETKIHKFPQGLRRIGVGGEDDQYIVPSFVALGPYHRGRPHLQKSEELKHAAAHYLCTKSGHAVEEVYGKVLFVAGEARGLYDEDAVMGFSEHEFAEIMFLDGCFLLHYIANDLNCPLLTNRMVLSTGPCMLRDIMLLENQIPWLVIDTLVSFFSPVNVHEFLANMILFDFIHVAGERVEDFSKTSGPHLLGLLRSYLTEGVASSELSDEDDNTKMFSSAIELSEMGIKLNPSNNALFADIKLRSNKKVPRLLLGELSLAPFFLNDITACWLVNMAALEACCSKEYPHDGFIVSSYLSLVAMLMDKFMDSSSALTFPSWRC